MAISVQGDMYESLRNLCSQCYFFFHLLLFHIVLVGNLGFIYKYVRLPYLFEFVITTLYCHVCLVLSYSVTILYPYIVYVFQIGDFSSAILRYLFWCFIKLDLFFMYNYCQSFSIGDTYMCATDTRAVAKLKRWRHVCVRQIWIAISLTAFVLFRLRGKFVTLCSIG